jgi:Mg2+ and Co2+ transporter CorA
MNEHFELHPLALEDVTHAGRRPKLDEYDKQQFIVMNRRTGPTASKPSR